MMNTNFFYPHSLSFVKNKAKQLQKAMPGMKLSVAQEATASALGFSSWFDCEKRCNSDQNHAASVYDEDLSRDEFLGRRHYQFCSLVESGKVAPGDASVFVRAWSLTSRSPAEQQSKYTHPYCDVIRDIDAMKKGELDWAKIDWEDDPETITNDIVYGSVGTKRMYYVLNHTAYNKLPPFMRGNACCYLSSESGKALALFLSEMDQSEEDPKNGFVYLREYQPWHYEWMTNHNSQRSGHLGLKTLRELLEIAQQNPDGWFPLSCRCIYPERDSSESIKYYMPAVKGAQFRDFIESGGVINLHEVQWFSMSESDHFELFSPLSDSPQMPIDTSKLQPCAPVYHYPFKHFPMGNSEFDWMLEGGGLRLDEEIDWAEYSD